MIQGKTSHEVRTASKQVFEVIFFFYLTTDNLDANLCMYPYLVNVPIPIGETLTSIGTQPKRLKILALPEVKPYGKS